MGNNTFSDDMARDARNAYARKWRSENKDKVKAANMRYWAKRAKREKQNEADSIVEKTRESGE